MFDELFDRLRQRITEAALPPVHQAIKDKYGESTGLVASTWSGEEEWYKFLVLLDGTVITVDNSHMDTISGHKGPMEPNDGFLVNEFMDTGGIQGKIDVQSREMDLWYENKLKPAQIRTVLRLWKEHRCRYLTLDADGDRVNGAEISIDRVAAVLEYGPEMLQHATAEGFQMDLHDHLLHLKEKSASLPDLQQKVKDTFKVSDDLAYNNFEGEENRCKGWVLNDGSVIPVDYVHADVPAEILKLEAEDDEEAEDLNLPAIAFEEMMTSGAFRLSIIPDEAILIGNSAGKLTEPQIAKLKKLFREYECDNVYVDVDGDFVESRIDSIERLDAILRYGKEMAMSERRSHKRICESLPPVQAELKQRVRPSLDLAPSTWSGEEHWLKFLILNDGSVIPVEKSHRGTIVGRNLVPGPLFSEDEDHYHNPKHAATQVAFYDTGAVEGKFAPNRGEMDLYWDDKITDEQIDAAVRLYKKYGASRLYANNRKGAGIDSAERLEAVLRYGEEMAMAESIREAVAPGEAGFIRPDGSLLTFEEPSMQHPVYAIRWLIDNGKMDPDKPPSTREKYKQFIKETSYIRWYTAVNGSMSVEINIPPTEAQFRTIASVSRNGEEFYWDYDGFGDHHTDTGRDLNSLRSFLTSNDLIGEPVESEVSANETNP